MDTLRWILLVIGILVLAGIYFFGKRSEWRQRMRGGEQNEPRFEDARDAEGWDDETDVIVLPKRQTIDSASETVTADEWQDDAHPVRHEISIDVTEELEDVDAETGASENDWVEEERPTRSGSESAGRSLQTPEVDGPPAEDDGWIDDVRPVKHAPAQTQSSPSGRDGGERRPPAHGRASFQEEPGQPEELLIIHVMSEPGTFFTGADIEEAFAANDLSFGDMQIYHRNADRGQPLFSVINMIKPGVFDPDRFSELETPGISLFMQLPGPEQPMVAFRALSDCVQRLAERLGGRLQDESHSTLTTQTLGHYEERVRSYIQHHARRAGEGRV